ncbi:MAG TPA: ABC-2 family transporter protein [Trueperaceae bacterium]|nr:ABC-2 family transporter protein [Trueperaceae bacterium]
MPDVLAYWGFARTRMVDLLANRARFLAGIASYFIYVSVYAGIFRAIYDAGPEEIGGLGIREALTYTAVAWVLRSMYTNGVDREITQEVRRGDIALALLRPVDYPASKLATAAGEALTRALIFTLPAALPIILVYPVQPPASLSSAVGFLAGAVLAFGIYSLVNLLVGITAVFTEHTVGIQRAKNAMMDLLGGVLLPLSFFPAWAQDALWLLPFQAVTYTPVSMYLGTTPVPVGLGVQALWLVILALLVRVLWRRAVDHLTIQGG